MRYPSYLNKLIEAFRKLPGVGNKSAQRYVFQMTSWPENQIIEFARLMESFANEMTTCSICGCLIEKNCQFCHSSHRDSHTICLVASSKDIFSLEKTHEYKGLYHVLGGTLSPLEGIGPDQLNFNALLNRINTLGVKEMIIALDSTIEGDATALYLKELLADRPIQISRLALGLPMGSSLEGIDGGTLAQALCGRRSF
jgi:recombination protein RecR